MLESLQLFSKLEKKANEINIYKYAEPESENYLFLIKGFIESLLYMVKFNGADAIKNVILDLHEEHQYFVCKYAFFNCDTTSFKDIFLAFNDDVINDFINFILNEKSIELERVESIIGDEFLRKRLNLHSDDSKFSDKSKYRKAHNSVRSTLSDSLKNEVSKFEIENIRLKNEVNTAKETIFKANKKISSLESEKEKIEQQLNSKFDEEVKNTLGKFVNKAMAELKIKEKKYSYMSFYWLLAGAITSVGLMVSVAFIMYWMSEYINDGQQRQLTWAVLIYYIGKGIVILSAFTTLSYYCFKQSNSYVHESLKQGERIHAIRFGQLCLRLYGKQIDETQIKTVFEDWNINSNTAFSNNNKKGMADIPGNVANILKASIESISKKS